MNRVDDTLKEILQPSHVMTEMDYPILYNFIEEDVEMDPIIRSEWKRIQSTKLSLLEKEMREIQKRLYEIVGRESKLQRLLMEAEGNKAVHQKVYDYFNAGLWNYNPVYILEYRQIPVL